MSLESLQFAAKPSKMLGAKHHGVSGGSDGQEAENHEAPGRSGALFGAGKGVIMNKGKQNGLPLKVSCGVLVAMLDRGTGWLTEQDRAA